MTDWELGLPYINGWRREGEIQPITYYVLDEQNLADKMFMIIYIITTGKLRMYVFMILFSWRLSLLL